uniref:Uncharacterized protein n=1 Tax=Cannabis sativa TaxID=3483 RepID=A0A803PZW9_CANSA
MVNSLTKERDGLTCPRILIEVTMDQQFPGFIDFENEHGFNVQVGVKYEWKPVNFVGLLETRVKAPKLGNLYSNVFAGWCFSSNIAWYAGGKIVIAWNPLRFIVDIIRCTSQLMHLRIVTVDGIFDSYLTVIYASNSQNERRDLWRDVCELAPNGKWCLMGDFNEILSKEERIAHRVKSYPNDDFLNCVNECHLEDVKFSGNFFTWSNKKHGEDQIYSKIDRILTNQTWLNAYENVEATFLSEGLFDHCPRILTLDLETAYRGSKMFQVVSRMKLFKRVLKDINKEGYMDLQAATTTAKANLDNIQTRLQQSPLNFELHNEEKEARERYVKVQQDYVSFLKQKAKMAWIHDGDNNTTLFHASIKQRLRQNRIFSIEQQNGERVNDPFLVQEAFLSYYKSLLGTKMENRKSVVKGILRRDPMVSQEHSELLMRKITLNEVKKAVFDIPGSKSPGPNGYSSYFFQDIWETIGDTIFQAVSSFL